MKESKRTHRFSVTLSFAPKRSSDRNFCQTIDSFTYIYSALLPQHWQHWALYAKVDSSPHLYIYILRCSALFPLFHYCKCKSITTPSLWYNPHNHNNLWCKMEWANDLNFFLKVSDFKRVVIILCIFCQFQCIYSLVPCAYSLVDNKFISFTTFILQQLFSMFPRHLLTHTFVNNSLSIIHWYIRQFLYRLHSIYSL